MTLRALVLCQSKSLTDRLTANWLTDWLTDWLAADWLTADWLTDWLTAAWLTDRQTDWLSACNEWGVNSTIFLRRYSKHPWRSLIRIFCTCAQKTLGLRSKEQVEDNIFERKVSWIKSSVQFVAKLNAICIYTKPLIKWPGTWLSAARGDHLKFTK